MIERRERRRRDGTSYHVWRVRYLDGGRERSKTFDRASDARAFEAKVRMLKRTDALAELDAGTETLAEFVEQWWSDYAIPNLERATLVNYAGLWNRHGLPRLGAYRLRDLTPQRIAQFRAELEADGVGAETVRKTMVIVQGVLQRAVEWQRIRSNPVRVTRKPRSRRQRAIHVIAPLTVERIRKPLSEAGRHRDAALVSVLAYAGLRPQEALALRWRHVRKHTLLVEGALADGREKDQKTHRPPPHRRPPSPPARRPRGVAAAAGPARRRGARLPDEPRPTLPRDRLAQLAPTHL